MTDVRTVLQDVLRDTLDDPTIVLEDSKSAKDFEDWDSLQHINIVIALEKALGIRFTTSEISSLNRPGQNIGTFVQVLETKVAAR